MLDPKRSQALLNEYKGNIFEFLVAKNLSMLFKCERHFLEGLSSGITQMLEQQELFIRTFYPHLLYELTQLSLTCAKKITNEVQEKNALGITLVGKIQSSLNHQSYDESDIMINFKESKQKISIKLSKSGAFVNTKSAGIKSFFKKYFQLYSSEDIQRGFNKLCDFYYQEMAIKMHQDQGLVCSDGFEVWISEGKAQLPGQLDEASKKHLYEYYNKVNLEMFRLFKFFYEKDKKLFKKCLYPLLGHSQKDIMQVSAYYQMKNNIFTKTNTLITYADKELKILAMTCQKNSFNILFKDFNLQIRLKPMNKFTTRSFKINCGVKSLV